MIHIYLAIHNTVMMVIQEDLWLISKIIIKNYNRIDKVMYDNQFKGKWFMSEGMPGSTDDAKYYSDYIYTLQHESSYCKGYNLWTIDNLLNPDNNLYKKIFKHKNNFYDFSDLGRQILPTPPPPPLKIAWDNGSITTASGEITKEGKTIPEIYKEFTTTKIYDFSWINLIEQHNTSNILQNYGISVEKSSDMITYTFGEGIYKVNQQIWLSRNTTIKGANIVNKPFQTPLRDLPTLSGNISQHTIFMAVTPDGSGCFNNQDNCSGITQKGKNRHPLLSDAGIYNPIIDKDMKIGFLLNNNTHL